MRPAVRTTTSCPSTEQLFLRFRENGDADALGEVFDRTAPKLLLLAMHMVQDASVAEDLVQSAFVAAIESARRYRQGTPLLAWLTRILSNRAKAERHAMRRRRQVPERLGAEDPELQKRPVEDASEPPGGYLDRGR